MIALALLITTAAFLLGACGSSAADTPATPTASPTESSSAPLTGAGLVLDPQLVHALAPSDSSIQIVDARPVEEYEAGHIPGALSLPEGSLAVTRDGVPKLAADPADLARAFGAAGIAPETTAVVYDAEGGKVGSRLFWLFEYVGHPDVRFLDGGLKAWTSDGFPVTSEVPTPPESDYPVRPNPAVAITADDVAAHLDDPQVVIIDARSPDEYAGLDIRAERGGHIPGAVLRDWRGNLQPNGRLLSLTRLREYYQGTGALDAELVIVYCQSGHRATHTYLALRALGLTTVALYDASWIEWGNSDRPIETGEEAAADVDGCDIEDTTWLKDADLRNCDLSGRDLAGFTLVGANLSSADLTKTSLREANLSRANLQSASLSHADFSYADLGGVDLTGADLSGADLSEAHLHDATVIDVVWSDTICPDGTNSDSNGGSCDGHLYIPFEAEADPCA